MLPTFWPPTIWTISLEYYRKPSILAADDFLGACYRKAMTPKKLWTLLFSPENLKIDTFWGGGGTQFYGQNDFMDMWAFLKIAASVILQFGGIQDRAKGRQPQAQKEKNSCI